MTVVDASAILELMTDGPGADRVAAALDGAALSAVSLAEVVGRLVLAGLDARHLAERLTAAGVVIEPLRPDDAELAGAMRSLRGGRALSLGDRCALALTVRARPAEVLTAQSAWRSLNLPIRVCVLPKLAPATRLPPLSTDPI